MQSLTKLLVFVLALLNFLCIPIIRSDFDLKRGKDYEVHFSSYTTPQTRENDLKYIVDVLHDTLQIDLGLLEDKHKNPDTPFGLEYFFRIAVDSGDDIIVFVMSERQGLVGKATLSKIVLNGQIQLTYLDVTRFSDSNERFLCTIVKKDSVISKLALLRTKEKKLPYFEKIF